MTFFFDNNLSKGLPHGLSAFGESAVHLTDHFTPNEQDHVWLEHIGRKGWFLVTRDRRIRHRPLELAALKGFGVGAFFLMGKDMSRWQLVLQVVRGWQQMKGKATSTTPPFGYSVSRAGKKLTRIPLN